MYKHQVFCAEAQYVVFKAAQRSYWRPMVNNLLGNHAHLHPGVQGHSAEHREGLRGVDIEAVHEDAHSLLDKVCRAKLTGVSAVSHSAAPIYPKPPRHPES
jgi:hypothetical protein